MERRDVLWIVNEIHKFEKEDIQTGIIEKVSKQHYRFNYNNQNINVILWKSNEKAYTLKIDGYTYKVDVSDELDVLIERLGFNKSNVTSIKSINAPMPGLVIDILVNQGDEVKKGDSILVLEAMKMENVIKAEGDGTISLIMVKRGDKVDKLQEMIRL